MDDVQRLDRAWAVILFAVHHPTPWRRTGQGFLFQGRNASRRVAREREAKAVRPGDAITHDPRPKAQGLGVRGAGIQDRPGRTETGFLGA